MGKNNSNDESGTNKTGKLSRRSVIRGASAVAALDLASAFRIPAASAQSTLPTPPNFPAGISLYQQAYKNWSGEIVIQNVWTCAPNVSADVATLANWAHANGWRLRPRGKMHGWSPFLLPAGATGANYVLVDTTQHLTSVSTNAAGSPKTFTAQTGVTLDSLLQTLENAGLGLLTAPAPGDLSLGGALAINAHGTAIPATGETRPSGGSYGSLSNAILSLTAVVWNGSQYVLQTFSRSSAGIKPLLAHLGRAFVTDVTMQVIANQNLRCQSWFNTAISTVLGPAGTSGSTLTSYLNSAGRVEVIWFPFTNTPWVKVWTVAPTKPLLSLQVNSPYNYSFTNSVSAQEASFIQQILTGAPSVTPSFCGFELTTVTSGLIATGTWDIWGKSKNVLLYVVPTTNIITQASWAVVTARGSVQRVVNEFYNMYQSRLTYYQNLGQYPQNGPVEIRVSGLDQPSEVGISGAQEPQLSSVRRRPDHASWDTAVWIAISNVPGTPGAAQFFRDMEQFFLSNYTGSYATVRPEWSKAWAFSATAAWSDSTILGTTIPTNVSAGQSAGDGWSAALSTLDSYDPYRIFSNDFLDGFMP